MLNIEKLGFSSCIDFLTVGRVDSFPPVELDNGYMLDDLATVADDNSKVYAIGYLIAEGDALEFVFDVALNQLASLEAWVTVPVATIQQLDQIIKGIVKDNGIKAEMHYILV